VTLRSFLRGIARARAWANAPRPAGRCPPAAVITPYPDGPYLVRGAFRVTDRQGNDIDLPRKTVALCRCGLSETPPWCDGSHKRRTGTFIGGTGGGAADEAPPGMRSRADHRPPIEAAAE